MLRLRGWRSPFFKVAQQLLETEYHGYIARMRLERYGIDGLLKKWGGLEQVIEIVVKGFVVHHRVRIHMYLFAFVAFQRLTQIQAVQFLLQMYSLQHHGVSLVAVVRQFFAFDAPVDMGGFKVVGEVKRINVVNAERNAVGAAIAIDVDNAANTVGKSAMQTAPIYHHYHFGLADATSRRLC